MRMGIVVSLAMAWCTCPAQDSLLHVLPLKNGMVYYADTTGVDTVKAEELYRRAKRFIADTYRGAVVTFDDHPTATIMARGSFTVFWTPAVGGVAEINVHHTLRLSAKDGRYRYELTDMEVSYLGDGHRYGVPRGSAEPIEQWNQNRPENKSRALLNVATEVDALISALQRSMVAPIVNDW